MQSSQRKHTVKKEKKRVEQKKQNKHNSHKKEVKLEYTGIFSAQAKGYGFVTVEGMEEDFFIPKHCVNGAYHQDKVIIVELPEQRGSRKEAEIKAVVERSFTKLVGTYQQSKHYGFVVPDNQKIRDDIFIPLPRSKGAVNGHKVVVELTSYGVGSKSPEGKIVEILGHQNDPGVDIMSIVSDYDLPVQFSEKVLHQAERVAKPVSDADAANRVDLRELCMVTIDGEDAKDLDDAVHVKVTESGYELGVHIADVANYIQENSAIDREATLRGTSVYLVDRVIPMIPHALSNGICSLNQGENRLALSCVMQIDSQGTVTSYELMESLICVDQRMTYANVSKILQGEEDLCQEYNQYVEMFHHMKEVAEQLRKRRMERGTIDFDFPESKIILDDQGVPLSIKPYDRNIASKIIEDFMLVANETVAQHFFWLELPFVYRNHEKPDGEKIEKLVTFLKNFGYGIKTWKDELHPKELQKLLSSIEGTPEESLLSRLILRSMKQAQYTTECSGHFGLACEYYCHFTSPIRRYPDLQIHRIIKEHLRDKLKKERINHYKMRLPEVAKHSSAMERRAAEAERETCKLKKAEYMEARIGHVYEGVISGITSWGIYVELPSTVEGMVHVSSLSGGYYEYNDKTHELSCKEKHQSYQLGQKITIQVKGVDKQMRTIDFMVAATDLEEGVDEKL
ncbi:MAG: ribonuclease R [Eubacteriales bacterium]